MPRPTLAYATIAALLAVILADRLLACVAPGWTLGAVPAIGLLLLCWRSPQLLRVREGQLTILATAIACLLPLHDSGWLAPGLAVIGLGLLVLQVNGWHWSGVSAALTAIGGTAAVSPLQLHEDMRALAAQQPSAGGLGRLLGRWVLPLAIAAVFAVLFSIANPVIGTWCTAVGTWLGRLLDGWWNLLPTPLRIVLWWLLSLGAWWVLRGRITQTPEIVTVSVAPADRTDQAVRILITCNLLFLVQTALDACYLWGHAALPVGLGWAEYAHRGAWPLMIAVLISVALVLWAFAPGGAAERSRPARWLVGLWLAQNALLVAGAVRRLDLYVDVYGLSCWRLAAALWMALVAVGLGLLLWRILAGRSSRWLIDVNALATVCALFLAAAIDADGLIAWHNVRHCRETGGAGAALDLDYLRQLGPGAVPALAWLSLNVRDPVIAGAARQLVVADASMAGTHVADWRGFTIVRQRAVATAAAAH